MAAALWLSVALAAAPVMPVDDVRSGARGQCLTVFEGTEIEPMDFTVKGVMPDFLGPGSDLVLVRLLGEKPEFTGVVAGMSGSPCSIDGKLLGALAYAFGTFPKEPIAGITPIAGMRDALDAPADGRPWRLPVDASRAVSLPPAAATEPAELAGNTRFWEAVARGEAPASSATPAAEQLRPIAAPLSIGGMTPAIQQHFAPMFRAMGFVPVQGGAASGKPTKPRPLEAGAPVAAVLVRGDVDIAATGTVTSVRDDAVLAFGHPFFGAGPVSLPMANATILNTMASQLRSYKMSVTGATVGEVTQDRLTAIGGYVGRRPKMIPVAGSIKTPAGEQQFTFEVARDLNLSPRFIAVGLANSLSGRVDAGQRGTLRFRATVKAEGLEPLRMENVYASERNAALFVQPAIRVARAVATMWKTPFGPPPPISVQVDARYEPQPIEERIESLTADRSVVRPGEAVVLEARLRRDNGGIKHVRFRVPAAESWAGETLRFLVSGARGANQLQQALAGRPQPRSLEDIRHWLAERRSDGYLYLQGVGKGTGMRVGTRYLPFLPPSVVAALSAGPDRAIRSRGLVWDERAARPGIVKGQAGVSVRVMPY